ncbi:MAG TPA: hypothetical protein VFG87_07515 [Amycolatopsis sp.]|nr:hypothetical protein [Amycolatopsis sp.]
MVDGTDLSARPWPDDEPDDEPVKAPEPTEPTGAAFPAAVAGVAEGGTERTVAGPVRRTAPVLVAAVGVTVGVTVVVAGLARRARR